MEESYRSSGSTQSLAWKLMKRLNSRHVGSFVLGNKHHITRKESATARGTTPWGNTMFPMFVEWIISKTPPNTNIVVFTLQEISVALLWTPLVPGLSWTVCSWPPSWLQGQDPDLGHTVTHCDCLILLRTYNCTVESFVWGFTIPTRLHYRCSLTRRYVCWGPYLQLKWVLWGGQEGACWGGLMTTSVGQPGLKNQASSCWTLKTDRSLPDRLTGLRKRDTERVIMREHWTLPEPPSTLKVWPFPCERNWKRQLMGRGNVQNAEAGGCGGQHSWLFLLRSAGRGPDGH